MPDKHRHFKDDGKNRTGNGSLNVILKRVRANNVALQKAKSITISECVSVALGIQQAKRMRRTVFSSVACFVLSHFFTLYLKGIFRGGGGGGIIDYKMCIFDCLF